MLLCHPAVELKRLRHFILEEETQTFFFFSLVPQKHVGVEAYSRWKIFPLMELSKVGNRD